MVPFCKDLPVSELALKYGVYAMVIHRWKKEAWAGIEATFPVSSKRWMRITKHKLKRLMQRLLSKALNWIFRTCLQLLGVRRRKEMIEPSNEPLSITAQCRLLSLSRSSGYYMPKGENPLNLTLMRLIDAQFLITPYYGSRQMARHLQRDGYCVGRHRVRRLMRKMGIKAI